MAGGTADLLVLTAPGFAGMMSLGPAGPALYDGPGSVLCNPARLSGGFEASGGSWNLETALVSAGVGFGAGMLDLGAGVCYVGKGGLVERDSTGTVTGEYSFGSGFACLGAGVPLTDVLSAGLSAGIAWETIAGETGTGPVLNAGLSFVPTDRLELAAAVTAVGQAPDWNGVRKDMPTGMAAGGIYDPGGPVDVFAGARLGLSTASSFGGGARLALGGLRCSAGYSMTPDEDELTGFFAGLGYTYSAEGVYRLELAVSQRRELAWPVSAGLSVSF